MCTVLGVDHDARQPDTSQLQLGEIRENKGSHRSTQSFLSRSYVVVAVGDCFAL